LALSIAIGMFIGLFIPIGLQSVILIVAAFIIGTNFVISFFISLVSNPFTVIFIYYLEIRIGQFITGIYIDWESFANIIKDADFMRFISLGKDTLIVFFSGAFIFAMIITIPVYLISFKLVKRLEYKDNAEEK
jgi:uncharacterized protein (DUF2062 family)